MRWVVAIAFSLLILVLVNDMRPEKTPKYNPYRKLPDTGIHYLVRLHDRETGRFFCSGSVISDRYILTAAHCIVGRSTTVSDIEVRTDKGDKIQLYAMLSKASGQADLALLSGHFEKFSHVSVVADTRDLIVTYNTPGRFIVACGFPYGGNPFCTQFVYDHPYAFAMEGRGFLYPGMSGGPVIDGLTGHLIGVNTAAGDNFILVSPTIELFKNLEVEVEE